MAKAKPYVPPERITSAFPEQSGNVTNGLNETQYRRASPFFWHPPDRQSHGELQKVVLKYVMGEPQVGAEFMHSVRGGPERGPEPVAKLTLLPLPTLNPIPSTSRPLPWSTRLTGWALPP